jgi:hypothetical protein
MRFVVGGEVHDLTREQVDRTMKGAQPEVIRKHLVEVRGTVFPPKQVFAAVTGRERGTFTTQEAQRVLTRLGFVCREADETRGGQAVWKHVVEPEPTIDDRVASVENAVATSQAAIADLLRRVQQLETSR